MMRLSIISFKTQTEKLFFGFLSQKCLNLKCQRACFSLIVGSRIVRVYGNPVNGSASVSHKTRDQDVKARDEKDFWTQEPACVPSSSESTAGLRRQTWSPSTAPSEPLPGSSDECHFLVWEFCTVEILTWFEAHSSPMLSWGNSH